MIRWYERCQKIIQTFQINERSRKSIRTILIAYSRPNKQNIKHIDKIIFRRILVLR